MLTLSGETIEMTMVGSDTFGANFVVNDLAHVIRS